MVDMFVDWPMPLVWLMAVGLILSNRKGGRRLVWASALMLVVSAMPIVGQVLGTPLSWGTIKDVNQLGAGSAKAVLVPTAGSFRAASERWWPEEGSIRRLSAALLVGRKLNLPTIIAGGSPYVGQPAEAKTVHDLMVADGANVVVLPEGRNSAETAAALAKLNPELRSPVILVTNHRHVARMRASLRRHGIEVVASIPVHRVSPPTGHARQPWWKMIVPSDNGLDATAAALHEYVGIAWYLVTGRIRIGDF